MSHIALRITPQDYAPPALIGRMRSIAMIVGAIGAVGALICAFVSWNIFLRAWLVGFLFWLGLTTGSLCLLMLQYTSGGNWGQTWPPHMGSRRKQSLADVPAVAAVGAGDEEYLPLGPI